MGNINFDETQILQVMLAEMGKLVSLFNAGLIKKLYSDLASGTSNIMKDSIQF